MTICFRKTIFTRDIEKERLNGKLREKKEARDSICIHTHTHRHTYVYKHNGHILKFNNGLQLSLVEEANIEIQRSVHKLAGIFNITTPYILHQVTNCLLLKASLCNAGQSVAFLVLTS